MSHEEVRGGAGGILDVRHVDSWRVIAPFVSGSPKAK